MAMLLTRLWLHFVLFLAPKRMLQNFIAVGIFGDGYHFFTEIIAFMSMLILLRLSIMQNFR